MLRDIGSNQYCGLTMKPNKYFFLTALLMTAFFSGCFKIADIKQKETFSRISEAYRRAIVWSDFVYASAFLKDGRQNYPLDPIYQNIKVTSYETIHHSGSAGDNQIEQTVSINYYQTDRMVEKNILDHQVWQWEDTEEIWRLTTGLPRFE